MVDLELFDLDLDAVGLLCFVLLAFETILLLLVLLPMPRVLRAGIDRVFKFFASLSVVKLGAVVLLGGAVFVFLDQLRRFFHEAEHLQEDSLIPQNLPIVHGCERLVHAEKHSFQLGVGIFLLVVIACIKLQMNRYEATIKELEAKIAGKKEAEPVQEKPAKEKKND